MSTTINKIREMLSLPQLRKFYAEAKLDDGRLIVTEAEAMDIGVELFVMTEDGQTEPLDSGEYALEDGTIVKVEDGRLSQLGDDVVVEEEVEALAEDEVVVEEEMGMKDKLKELGLEDGLADKVVAIVEEMGYGKKEEMSEEAKAAFVTSEEFAALAAQVSDGFKALLSRVSKVEDMPADDGVKFTPTPTELSNATQPRKFSNSAERALYEITKSLN